MELQRTGTGRVVESTVNSSAENGSHLYKPCQHINKTQLFVISTDEKLKNVTTKNSQEDQLQVYIRVHLYYYKSFKTWRFASIKPHHQLSYFCMIKLQLLP